MFLVSDTMEERHKYIRRFVVAGDASVAILLAAADFERCLKRGILALGQSPTKEIKEKIFRPPFHGLEAFKKAWIAEVRPLHKINLPGGVVQNWSDFVRAYNCRHSLIHGATSKMTQKFASEMTSRILAASVQLHHFAATRGKDLDKKIVRRVGKRIAG
jgi:hypothetical protein